MSMGAILRQRRDELGLTQDRVAASVGISKPYLSNIETGKARPPTDGVLRALERALNFNPGELVQMSHLMKTPADVRQRHEELEIEAGRLRAAIRDLMSAARKEDGHVDLAALTAQLQGEAQSYADELPGGQAGSRVTAARRVPVVNRVAGGYPLHLADLDYPPNIPEEYVCCPDLHDGRAFAVRVVGDAMEPAYVQGDIVILSPGTTARPGDDCLVRLQADASTAFGRFYQDGDDAIRLQPLNGKYPARTLQRAMVSGLWPAVFRIHKLRE